MKKIYRFKECLISFFLVIKIYKKKRIKIMTGIVSSESPFLGSFRPTNNSRLHSEIP